MSQIVESIREFITQEITHGTADQELDPDLSLLEEGILDSLGLQQLITFLEQKFAISVDDADLMPENFESINAIAKLIKKYQ
jgi:acyl carrier protein